MPGQTFAFQVNFNETKSVGPFAFRAQAIGIDNPTPSFIHLPDAPFGAWIRPFRYGVMVPITLITHVGVLRISSADAPPQGAAPTVGNAQFTACLVFEDPQPFSPGYDVGSAVHQNAFPTISRGVGTYTYRIAMPAGAKGIVAYLNVTAGGGTVTMTIFNSDGVLGGSTDNLLATTPIAAGSGANLYLYPGITVSANLQYNGVLGVGPGIQCGVATAATTFGVDYDYLY